MVLPGAVVARFPAYLVLRYLQSLPRRYMDPKPERVVLALDFNLDIPRQIVKMDNSEVYAQQDRILTMYLRLHLAAQATKI
jgi:hypothetical protein